ncbi:hypothetical protein B0T21DRAFT_380761 [Apiosordaria backusii]|uniref:Uncharacterized protein n=1 Tax=Apiosordaria backusii TaxID=314023 RepID=A0AA40ES58_9PEZI|nr:hypothetical protein B0T21DRAFT_380761 [Apiosordaria backusii]
MGHSSKFPFSLPGRKHKQPQPVAPAAPLSISEPLTKAQRILGTTAISLDLAGATSDTTKWGPWEGQSNAGISINVTESPAGRDTASSRLGSARRDDALHGSSGNRDRRWEEESAVLPKDNMTRSGRHDDTTDASSLRRQQSSSTIRSYYDKAKVPLAISQQTANSAMAKGLPSKAHAILDFEGNFNTEPKGLKKKKPSRLDLSSLLSKRSHKHLRPEPGSGHVLGFDMLTTSPSSVMSSSSASTPPPIAQRIDRKLRNKMTKESLREQAPSPDPRPSPISSTGRSDSAKQIPIKPNAELHNLYDHYEQKTFDEALEHNYRQIPERRGPPPDRALPAYPTPPTSNTGKPSLSPFPRSASRTGHAKDPPPLTVTVPDVHLVRPPSVPSLVSPMADCASISSRHTRTSKASKRTDRSLTEIDLLQNSVLALSSDSEDDYDACSDQLAVPPPPSDGPASPVSPRSAMSQPSFARSEDSSRSKASKQTTFAENPQYFPSREQQAAAPKLPKPSPRSSSLAPNSTMKSSQIYPSQNRSSSGTTGTARTHGYSALQTPTTHEAQVINMMPKNKFQDQPVWSVPEETQFEDFPAPPIHPTQRPPQPSRPEQTPPLSPTSVDFYLQSQRSSGSTQDTGSIGSGGSRGSGNRSGRRSSAASSIIQDNQSGRFMAVTRQEEMLLAALRQKRARMREDILAEYEDDADREEQHSLQREVTNDSSGMSMMSRQSSLSKNTVRVETNPLTARPRHQDSVRSRDSSVSAEQNGKHGHILVMMDESNPDMGPIAQLDYFPAPAESDRRGSKSNSRSGPPHKQRASLSAMSMPTASARRPPRSASLPRRGSSDQISVHSTNPVNNSIPKQILEDPAEDEEDEGVPRPDSPISPSDFPVPVSATNSSAKIVNKKHLRLSAFGTYKPNVEAGWWDDSG